MKHSIQARLLLTTTFVLVVFLTLTAGALDRAFRASVVAGAEEQLRLVIYSLMGSVQQEAGQLTFSQGISEPRLTQPDSGLYAQVANDLGSVVWLSPSALTTDVNFPRGYSAPGLFEFSEIDALIPRFQLSYTVIWEGVDAEYVVFSAVTDQRPYRVAIAEFRRSLGLGLGVAMLLFILVQFLALRWGLKPLRMMAAEVHELEMGRRESLSQRYPKELQGLALNLDHFIVHEQRTRARYRYALDDLAHSLKTPLAVVRNSLSDSSENSLLVSEQLERMETTVLHQLSKASAGGPVMGGKTIVLRTVIERLLRALQTAYVDRDVHVERQLPADLVIRGDERDIMEIVGNLLENAFKYSRGAVRVEVSSVEGGALKAQIVVEDDGPGIPRALRDEVVRRGKRLDEIEAGQGIGLAVVVELVALYNGSLDISDSRLLGGAKLTVLLP